MFESCVEALTLKMGVHPYAHDSMSLKQQQSSPGLIVAARSFEVRGGMFILAVRGLTFTTTPFYSSKERRVPKDCKPG